MTVTHGSVLKFYAAADNAGVPDTFYEVEGIRSVNYDPKLDIVDVTTFKGVHAGDDYAGAKKRATTLESFAIKCAGLWDDTSGPYAGYSGVVKSSGTSTAMTNEACGLVSGKIYQITATAKRVINPEVAVTVKDNSVTVAATNYSIDYLFGRITFIPAYTPTTPITITGEYLPLVDRATVKGWSFEESCDLDDATVLHATNHHHKVNPQLIDMSGKLDVLEALSDDPGSGTGKLRDLLIASTRKVLEITLGASGKAMRAFVMFNAESVPIQVDKNIVANASWVLNKDVHANVDPGSSASFSYSWVTDTTGQGTIRSALRNLTRLWLKVLPNGTAGWYTGGYVSRMSVDNKQGEYLAVSYDFESDQAITAV